MVRRAVVAGQFYPHRKEELIESIQDSFTSSFGPGELPGERGKEKLSGAIVPHAGYVFSGASAAWVYKEVGEAEFPDVYIILGVNHTGHWTCSSDEEWETPLGTVNADKELAKKLASKGLDVNNLAHRREHSIEVQLPFLQFVSADKTDDLRILPIMITDDQFSDWAKIISEGVSELGRRAVVLCSSDFTHYGANYGYLPFDSDVKENMNKLDGGAIDIIENKDPAGFLSYVEKTGATICGQYGIAVLLELMKEKKGEILKYYTSGDVLGDYKNSVGYAAIVFK